MLLLLLPHHRIMRSSVFGHNAQRKLESVRFVENLGENLIRAVVEPYTDADTIMGIVPTRYGEHELTVDPQDDVVIARHVHAHIGVASHFYVRVRVRPLSG